MRWRLLVPYAAVARFVRVGDKPYGTSARQLLPIEGAGGAGQETCPKPALVLPCVSKGIAINAGST